MTNKNSILAGKADIDATMPTIGGVVNGAMVLKDTMFSNMDISVMQAVLQPKVDGSRFLDEMFSDNSLEFFIMFSSVACVVGNRGQANYLAANMYMTSLARQRRQRGLTAAALDLSAIVGIGYISRIGSNVMDNIRRTGVMPVSEKDFHQAFAEAVLASKCSSGSDPEIIMGLRLARRNDVSPVPWLNNPKFIHFVQETDDRPQQKNTQQAVQSIKTLLAEAVTVEEASSALQGESLTRCQVVYTHLANLYADCFLVKIRMIMLLSKEQTIDMEIPLIQLGVDSLVAVEIRNWFLREIEVDMPVLKILGGATITELLAEALDRIPSQYLSHIYGDGEPNKSGPVSEPDSLERSQEALETDSNITDEVSGNSSETDQPTLTDSVSSGISDTASEIQSDTHEWVRREVMSFGQARFWFLRKYLEDQTSFNIVLSAKVTGPINTRKLNDAVKAVSQTHESLRTRFFTTVKEGSLVPTQEVLKQSLLKLETQTAENEAEFYGMFAKMEKHEFDLEEGLTMRIILMTSSAQSHFLIIACHHIIMDEVSMQILLSDLEREYTGRAPDHAVLQYPD